MANKCFFLWTANYQGFWESVRETVFCSRSRLQSNLFRNTYTVFATPNADEFYTTPALTPVQNGVAGVGTATLYSSIMYAERFTNGPYTIQNNGDQIKITLNVALD